MRLLPFVFSFIEKFTPITPTDKMQLTTEAESNYNELKSSSELKKSVKKDPTLLAGLTDSQKSLANKPMTIPEKVVSITENWGVRMALAILFPIAIKKFTDWMNSSNDKSQDFDEDEDEL